MKIWIFIVICYFLPSSLSITQNRVDNYQDEPEDRRIRRRKRPCGRDLNGDGRTFFDWTYSYHNINHNYNYNINCGGGNYGPPLGGGVGGVGGNHHHNHHGGLLGGGGLFGSHGGGLFGTHGGTTAAGGGSSQTGGNDGPLGFGFLNLLGNTHSGTVGAVKPPVSEIPVHEDIDDTVPENYQKLRPGQYVSASNPYFGTYTQDVTNFNPNKIIRDVNREANQFFKPLYNLFKR